jgi:hypothetical protein
MLKRELVDLVETQKEEIALLRAELEEAKELIGELREINSNLREVSEDEEEAIYLVDMLKSAKARLDIGVETEKEEFEKTLEDLLELQVS